MNKRLYGIGIVAILIIAGFLGMMTTNDNVDIITDTSHGAEIGRGLNIDGRATSYDEFVTDDQGFRYGQGEWIPGVLDATYTATVNITANETYLTQSVHNITYDWGDGAETVVNSSVDWAEHEYLSNGTYQLNMKIIYNDNSIEYRTYGIIIYDLQVLADVEMVNNATTDQYNNTFIYAYAVGTSGVVDHSINRNISDESLNEIYYTLHNTHNTTKYNDTQHILLLFNATEYYIFARSNITYTENITNMLWLDVAVGTIPTIYISPRTTKPIQEYGANIHADIDNITISAALYDTEAIAASRLMWDNIGGVYGTGTISDGELTNKEMVDFVEQAQHLFINSTTDNAYLPESLDGAFTVDSSHEYSYIDDSLRAGAVYGAGVYNASGGRVGLKVLADYMADSPVNATANTHILNLMVAGDKDTDIRFNLSVTTPWYISSIESDNIDYVIAPANGTYALIDPPAGSDESNYTFHIAKTAETGETNGTTGTTSEPTAWDNLVQWIKDNMLLSLVIAAIIGYVGYKYIYKKPRRRR